MLDKNANHKTLIADVTEQLQDRLPARHRKRDAERRPATPSESKDVEDRVLTRTQVGGRDGICL